MDISAVDWALLAILLVSMVIGAWRGLFYEVLSVLGWIAAFVLAQWFANDAGALLGLGAASESARYAAGFAAVFVLTLVVSGLLTALVKRLVQAVGLRPVDRALGALFGTVRGVLVLLFVMLVVGRTPLIRHAAWQESVGVKTLGVVAQWALPMLPPEVRRFWPES